MSKHVFIRSIAAASLLALSAPAFTQPTLEKLEGITHGPQLGNVSTT